MNIPEPPEYVELLAPYSDSIVAFVRAARNKILHLLPDCVEMLYDATTTVVVGYSFTGKISGLFVSLPVYRDHVTLVFPWGVKLHDPMNRLKGSGNQIRHTRLTTLEDLDDPYITGLIAAAVEIAPRPADALGPWTDVKIMKGPKRRPVARV